MDSSSIKEIIKQMEASYPKAMIYRVEYTVTDTRTDAYYQRRRDLISLIEKTLAEESALPSSSTQAFKDRYQGLTGLEKSFERELRFGPGSTYVADYSEDGTGFYMKQTYSYIGVDGKTSSRPPSIYVSNGKLMGTFYPEDAQGVIQPATERPQVPNDYWLDIAYRFDYRDISANFETWENLTLTETGDDIILNANNPGPEKSMGYRELHIDKASLLPRKMTSIGYNRLGKLSSETMKFWQYQDFSGVRLPKSVLEQEYHMDPEGKWNLEEQQTLTINGFALTARNSADEFNALLKSNYSIFDEITGTHYLSGNPATMLDNLSK